MYDSGKVIVGIIVFILIFSSPIWLNLASGTSATQPVLEKASKGTACVMETEYMRPNHMDLLNFWRDDVVRNADRVHTAPDGTKYNKSLSNTCLDCHVSRENFCNRCHNYMGVNPYCWTCHIVPGEVK